MTLAVGDYVSCAGEYGRIVFLNGDLVRVDIGGQVIEVTRRMVTRRKFKKVLK